MDRNELYHKAEELGIDLKKKSSRRKVFLGVGGVSPSDLEGRL